MASKSKKTPPKKKKTEAAPKKKRKSRLPDLITGKYCIAMDGREVAGTPAPPPFAILQSDGTAWLELPASPYIFPSKTHAQAYIDGMASHLKPAGAKIFAARLSEYYGQHFTITEGDPGQPEKILTALVERDKAVSFKQAVKRRLDEKYKQAFDVEHGAFKLELDEHRRELSERERAHRERMKAKKASVQAAEKAMKSFVSSMKKLGG
jgi:hypothetical protein